MALGEGTDGWGASGGMGVFPHICMHAHAIMHMCTCIEIANGHPHGSIHIYHVYNMHVHACMGQLPYTCTHPHPNPPTCHPQGTPGISRNSITLELIKII